jgi:protein involved in polysaccharide export with SLBB domain
MALLSGLGAGILALTGCATDPVDVDQLLRDWEARQKTPKTGAPVSSVGGTRAEGVDLPDAPDRNLPRVPGAPPSSSSPVPVPSSVPDQPSVVAGDARITIQPDCLVQIKVEEDHALDGSYPVNEIGAVELGYVGPVILYNRTESEAAQKIREVLETRHFRRATVSVKIIRASYDKIQVTGAVNQGGQVRIGAGDAISLNDALLRAGGLRPSVTGAKVRIVRGGLLSAVAPAMSGEVYALVTDEGKPCVPDVFLRNNDMAYVFSSQGEAAVEVGDKEVLVLGEVKRPGVYRFTGSEPCTMMHLVFKMGEFPLYANTKTVKVIRRDENESQQEYVVNVEKILQDGNPADDFALESGDRIIVPARRISLF